MLNCSRPDPPSLLEALDPVFSLSAIRPVKNISTPTNVSIDFILYSILEVDEKVQELTTYIWQLMQWKNEFVSWDPVQCGTETISIPRKKLWVPDVVINEFMYKNSAPYVPYVYLHYDGIVVDPQPIRVVSACHLDIYTFPFDIQNCTYTYNSYFHRSSALQIFLGLPIEDILDLSRTVFKTMGEWELLDITVYKHHLNVMGEAVDPFDELSFYIVLRRRATLYVVNILIPSCFLITVDLFSFLLPPQSVDRSAFKMTLILGYTVFLLMMSNMLPITGNTIPLINVFLSMCLALMVASLLETILITNFLCGSNKFSPVPSWVQVLVLHVLGHLVGLHPKPRDQEDNTVHSPPAQGDFVLCTKTEVKAIPLVAVDINADEKPPGEKEPEVEDKALEELRRLGRDLQAIRLQVDQHLTGNQSSEEWIQVGFIIDRLLFILYILFISVSFITIFCIWLKSYIQ